MHATIISLIVFAVLFGATLLGMRLRAALPQHHLSADTKDAVRIGMGLVATMAALVLGLLVASTKGAYDTSRSEVINISAKIVFLDRLLANYGPESADVRKALRNGVETAVVRIWPDQQSSRTQLDPSASPTESVATAIQNLTPQTDMQRTMKSKAADLAIELGQMRWLMYTQSDSSISMPMLIIVVAWLAIIFASTGLFAPSNATVIVTQLMAAFSVAAAIFLILELDMPFGGLIQISSEPMRNALSHLGR